VIFCLIYVVLFNVRNLVSGRDQALADPSRPPADNQAIFPNHAYAFGNALGIDQGWGLFAPRPGLFVGWILAVGIQKDGTHIDLLHDGQPIDDESPTTKPKFLSGTYANGRWRKMMMNLSLIDMGTGARAYPYLLPGYARYLYRDWNSRHEGRKELRAVEIVWWKEETRPPGVKSPPPQRLALIRYEGEAPPGKQWFLWKVTPYDQQVLLGNPMP
jgi:hypothetical protein